MAHYWRLDREAWPSVGESIRQSASTAIAVYIPWEVHETVPADLDAFLTLCEDTGLDVIARPAPQINADHWRDLQSLVLDSGRGLTTRWWRTSATAWRPLTPSPSGAR
jgi:beta-galactosidase GanA